MLTTYIAGMHWNNIGPAVIVPYLSNNDVDSDNADDDNNDFMQRLNGDGDHDDDYGDNACKYDNVHHRNYITLIPSCLLVCLPTIEQQSPHLCFSRVHLH